MSAREMAHNYNIAQSKTFGTMRTYYLDNMYRDRQAANSRVIDLKSMGFHARAVKVLKPESFPKTYHTAVYRSRN